MTEYQNPDAVSPKPDLPAAARRLSCKIGSTTYDVTIHFSKTSKENMNDKILRLVRNDLQRRLTE
ncbi:transposon-encoded TnpW family protein [Paenibacillus thermotolerans]|uniref:transposon-encoded TnpW family protein n=1 Tax=Paenibacillus thermotolerans TaxID=3027807 RepID=UPI0023684AE9|nr:MULTISPECIES: transposon-encoded TnpW family protein [unclassified Paenibacillus]